MDFLERDLEDIIYNASDEQLKKLGLWISGKRFRQLRIGNYGIADLVTAKIRETYEGQKYYQITIFELKRGQFGMEAYLQCIKYAMGIMSYLGERSDLEVVIDIVIIGKKIDTLSDIIYLPSLINGNNDRDVVPGFGDIFIYEYNYELDGLKFNRLGSGYRLANEGFNL